MLRTWFLTVFSEMTSSSAISRLARPRATSRSTSTSRSVSSGALPEIGSGSWLRLVNSVSRVAAIPAG